MSKVQPNLVQTFLFIKKGFKFVQLKEPLSSKLKSYELVNLKNLPRTSRSISTKFGKVC